MELSMNKRTYFRRVLPSPPAIAFSSAEGREIFIEALNLGTMIGFFKLIEQFITQEEPQYCGLAALSMTLNALGVDPRRTWKGSWRWFSETMLDCCKSMEDVKRDGITLGQAACLARCNGADVSVHRYGTFDGGTFRRLLREFCSSEDRHMVVSYSRKALKQSGDGHFSPVGGYHPERDLVLILDVARFKYAPHWVAVDDLLEAMALMDPAIGRPRGFLLMSCRQPRESALFSVAANLPVQETQPAPVTTTATQTKPAAPPAASAPSSTATIVTTCGTAMPVGATQGPNSLPAGGEAGCITAPTESATRTAVAMSYQEAEGFGGKMKGAAAAASGCQAGPADGVGVASKPYDLEKGTASDTRADGAAGNAPGCAAAPAAAVAAATATASAAAGVSAASSSTAGSCMEPEWAAAVRFLTRDAAAVVRLLLPGLRYGGSGGTEPDDGVHEDEEEAGGEGAGEDHKTQADGRLGAEAGAGAGLDPGVGLEGTTGTQGGASHGSDSNGSSTGVPSLETLVAALVAAAPVESVCTLLTRRQTLVAVGETRTGPCCGCATTTRAVSAAADAAAGGGDGGVSGPGAASAAAMPPPCNVSGCTRLTAAAVLAAAADGSAAVQRPPPAAGAAAASSSCSDAGSLDSGSDSGSSFGSHGSSSGGSSCCHGEPLQHHCVPPQVQALVLDELRFTNMFKLVRYCLRRRLGCLHVRPPDLTAFMRPAGEAAAKPAVNATATLPPSTAAPTAPIDPSPTLPPAAAAAEAAAGADEATSCCGGGCRKGSKGVGNHAAGNGVYDVAVNAGSPDCDCDVALPELAAEKLTALLLLLPEEAAGWWPAEPHVAAVAAAHGGACPGPASDAGKTHAVHPLPVSPQPAAVAGGSEDPSASRGAGVGGSGGMRLCGRPRCRTCRRRAAAAGDRLAALGVLREEWGRLLRLAPLGLFGSAPVLRDEISHIGLQLSDLERRFSGALADAAVA